MTWPGFVTEPCADCEHQGSKHQPKCIDWVNGGYCACPAYRSTAPQQVGMFDTPSSAVSS